MKFSRYMFVSAVFIAVFLVLIPTVFAQPSPRRPTATVEPIVTPEVEPETSAPTISSTPVATDPLDLAAMALDSSDLPPEFGLFYEVYLSGSDVAQGLTAGAISQREVDATGLLWFYESVYVTLDGNTRIRSYIEQYPTAEGAVAGFELLEDEVRLAPPGSQFSDSPGAGVGEEPSEISEGSLTPEGPNPEITSVDSTFRVGNLLAGVSVDTNPGTVADRQLAIDLSGELFNRINAVLANEPLPLIDPALPEKIASLGPDWEGRDEGYLSATEIFGPEIGPEFEGAFTSGYFNNQVPVASDQATLPLPVVSVTIAEFLDEGAPLLLLGRLEEFQPEFLDMARFEIDPIPGAGASVAFHYANPLLSGAEPDSVRIVSVVGPKLVVLDVQGNATLEGAEQGAVAIATAQAGCLDGSGSCGPVVLPPGSLAAPETVPGGEDAVG